MRAFLIILCICLAGCSSNYSMCEEDSDCVIVVDPGSWCCDAPAAINNDYYDEYNQRYNKEISEYNEECWGENAPLCPKSVYKPSCLNSECIVTEETY